MTGTARPRLAAVGVSKSFPGGPTVLGPCDVSVMDTEVLAIVGPSGTGKTTLLQMLAGLITPDRGRVELDGQPLLRPSARTAVVFQEYGLLPWRTVVRNVAFPLEVMGLARAERYRRAHRILDVVGLSEAAHKFPHQLSGGMRQRTALARALVGDPSVLLLDEPLSALDIATKRAMQQLLRDVIANMRLTTVLVTHDLMDAVRLGDRIVVLAGQPGQVVAVHQIDRNRPEQELVKEVAASVEAAVDHRPWHGAPTSEDEQTWVLT
jgi:NitT/TauT family transport system ATP-binding protein